VRECVCVCERVSMWECGSVGVCVHECVSECVYEVSK
jgi:hypothetical protein